MGRKGFLALGVAALCAALAIACDRTAKTPTSPSAATTASTNAAADGSTLKVNAPTPQSPINDEKVLNSPALTVGASSAKFGGDVPLQYHFQVFNDSGAMVWEGVGGTSLGIGATLDFNKRYTWRARAEYQGAAGPWSSTASFMSPDGAYLRGNELFDPLYNGQTIGRTNDVTFVPGQGVQLNSKESVVEWQLQTPLTAGEFSFEATNVGNGSEDWKTKIMSMLQGDGINITDNPYRFTLDKRPSGWNGQLRYTLRSGGVDAGEPNCGPTSWSRSSVYFFKYTWGGGQSRITVLDGGINGVVKKSCGASYAKVYQPNPHLIRLGSVRGRAGSESLPGVIIWNVWVSGNPRPQLPNDK